MKKIANTTDYTVFSQETNQKFLAIPNHLLSLKSDFTVFCSHITFLFQEKLPIVYANIRV